MKKQFASLRSKVPIESSSQLVNFWIYSKTDYQYSSNGINLAVSDSDGNVYIYQKAG